MHVIDALSFIPHIMLPEKNCFNIGQFCRVAEYVEYDTSFGHMAPLVSQESAAAVTLCFCRLTLKLAPPWFAQQKAQESFQIQPPNVKSKT